VSSRDVETLLHRIAEGVTAKKSQLAGERSRLRGGQGVATRTVSLLGAVMSLANKQRLRLDNPVQGCRPSRRSIASAASAIRSAPVWVQRCGPLPRPAFGRRPLPRRSSLRSRGAGAARRSVCAEPTLTQTGASLCCRIPSPAGRSASFHGQRWRPASDDAALVFPGSRGTAPMKSGFGWLFTRIAKLAGLPKDITRHTLT
jgi:hypothetical protein